MKILKKIILFSFLLPHLLFGQVTASNNFANLFSKFEAYSKNAQKDWKVPGLAIAVVHKGQPYYITNGTLSINSDQPVTEETRFFIASVTKVITSTVILKLAEKGIIDLDDPVVKYIKDFKLSDPEITKKITIKHILSQSVGLKGFAGDSFINLGFSPKEMKTVLEKFPIKKPFAYKYSNYFSSLMKSIVEKATGKSFEQIAQELIFKPLAMTKTTYDSPLESKGFLASCGSEKKLPHDFAKTHGVRENGLSEINPPREIFNYITSMGVSSTIIDMAEFTKFLLGYKPDILSQKYFDHFKIPINTFIEKSPKSHVFPKIRISGMGHTVGLLKMDYGKDRKVKIYTQNGARPGITSRIAICPELDVGIMILCNLGSNMDCLLTDALTFYFFDLLLDTSDKDWSKDFLEENKEDFYKFKKFFEQEKIMNPMPHNDLRSFEGIYNHDAYGKIELKIKDSAFKMRYQKNNKSSFSQWITLTHLNGNRFTFPSYKLNASLSANFIGYMDIGQWENKKALTCNLMRELDDPPIFILK